MRSLSGNSPSSENLQSHIIFNRFFFLFKAQLIADKKESYGKVVEKRGPLCLEWGYKKHKKMIIISTCFGWPVLFCFFAMVRRESAISGIRGPLYYDALRDIMCNIGYTQLVFACSVRTFLPFLQFQKCRVIKQDHPCLYLENILCEILLIRFSMLLLLH